MRRRFTLPLAVVLLAGCYHATVETGATPGPQVIDRPWAMGFVYGLVPPSTVSTAAQCPNGVARVETQHSFLNMVVQSVTFGIVTPMHIKVTCAASRMGAVDITVPVNRPLALQAGFAQAADLAVERKAPVFVEVRTTN